MAELALKLQQLQSLPEDLHVFCPRTGPDDNSCYFDEDLYGRLDNEDAVTRNKRLNAVKDAERRKKLVLECMQILAYDGSDAAKFKEWLTARLDAQMACCDVCIRIYHRARAELKADLEADYGEDVVADFLAVIDGLSIERIKKGLVQARDDLLAAPPDQRSPGALQASGLFALFEAISCEAFLRREDLLSEYFDEPFRLVQTKTRLRLKTFTPAMTAFLFSKQEDRWRWGFMTWTKFKRSPTGQEFDSDIKGPLSDAMRRVHMSNLEVDFLPTFWSGAKVIVSKLDKEVITHNLRALDMDICTLALDQLQLDSECFVDILGTMQMLLETSPTDFWEAMGTISPKTVIEQVFNSPSLKKLLLSVGEEETGDTEALQQTFSWVKPLLASIKASNQGPPCRSLCDQFLGRLQDEKYPPLVRSFCSRMGLEVLSHTISKLNEGESVSTFVGAATVSDVLDVVAHHVELLIGTIKDSAKLQQLDDSGNIALDVVQQALKLDCLSMVIDREMLVQNRPLQHDQGIQCGPLWKAVVQGINSDTVALAIRALIGARLLIGLEKFVTKASVPLPKEMARFNETFDQLSRNVSEIIERLNDLPPSTLKEIFENTGNANTVITTLFSSDMETRRATVELLKVVSSEDGRKEAVGYIVTSYFRNTLTAISMSLRRIAQRRVFTPASSTLKLSTDVIDVLCNSQDGLLRSKTLIGPEARAAEHFWQSLWQELTVIFEMTESWSDQGHDKTQMMEFCRDTMQFAERLFDECSIFASALNTASSDSEQPRDKASIAKALLEHPARTMSAAVKWLRLRDEFLSSKSVSLISKLLIRLHNVSIEVSKDSLTFVEGIITGKIRAKLSGQQTAELEQALERHVGHSVTAAKREAEEAAKRQKQGTISAFFKPGAATPESRKATSEDSDATDSDQLSKIVKDSSRTADAYKARILASKAKKEAEAAAARKAALAQKNTLDVAEFKRRREAEIAAKKKRDAAMLALATGRTGQAAEAGSGLAGLGVKGKDHAARGTGMMVSSDEESDDDDELDEELFGPKKVVKKDPALKAKVRAEMPPQGPVKKQRKVRSARDMRARLAPDLSNLHKTILGWDYFHEGDFPPNSRPDMYSAVPNTFRTPVDYQNTFQPLLTLEAWQVFVKAREESNFKPYEVKIVNRSSVDAFIEVSSTMTHAENKEISISEGDIALLGKAQNPATAADQPHCLARVWRITRKKAYLEVLYRVVPGNPLISSLVPNATIKGVKVQSITPLEREYGALAGLEYYDLCDEIIKAKPSPLLNYSDKHLDLIIANYKVNKAQAKAVKSAIDNDAFTLIQGPPGSGKTKTIVAIVGAILTDSLRENKATVIEKPRAPGMNGSAHNAPAPPKKLLVCAPSNAAVDELVMRFKEGVTTLSGQHRKLGVVRLGRSDAMNANVIDVTLDELVSKRLGLNQGDNQDQRKQTQELMKEHQAVSEKLREAREKLDAGGAKGEEATKLKEDFDTLRRRKAQLGAQIDSARDNENLQNRQADLNRRRAQQAVLDEAHVICATLSGSGHEMFQNLNIEFETVIVDEAAQCVEMSALIPLKYGCAKCILVGDPKQLPPTVFSKEAARFQYEQSLFVRMQGNHPDDVHLLDTQYRMHPEISAFPSQTFYDGRLLDGADMATLRERLWHASELLGPYRFFDVQGQHQAAPKGHSLINVAEIDVAMQLYERLTTDFNTFDFKGKVGIITPYKSQLRELKDRFARRYGQAVFDTIEFNTTDAFQGRESEIIIFSCVRASPAGGIGFLQDIRRMNVGLTRAKSSLWVLGNSESLARGEYWRKLVDDAKSRSRYIEGNRLMQLLRKPVKVDPTFVPRALNDAPTGPRDMNPRQAEPVRSNGDVKIKTERESAPLSVFKNERSMSLDEELFGAPPENKVRHKRKASIDSDEDVEMKDVKSESDRASSKNASGRSTPATDVKPKIEKSTANGWQASNGVSDRREGNAGGLRGSTATEPRTAPPPLRKKKPVDPFIKKPVPKRPRPA